MGSDTNIIDNLSQNLETASEVVTNRYFDDLEKLTIKTTTDEINNEDVAKHGKFYQLTKLVIDKEENYINKLTTIVNVVSANSCSIATIIDSDGIKVNYYFALLSKNAKRRTIDVSRRRSNESSFFGALRGNLAGSEVKELEADEVENIKKILETGKCYSSVSGIVALRDKDEKNVRAYVQGIENLTDSLKGLKYTLVMLADSVSASKIRNIKNGYELIFSQLSSFLRSSLTIQETDTATISDAQMKGISDGIAEGVGLTVGTTSSKSNFFGGNISGGINFFVQASVGVSGGVGTAEANTTAEQKITNKLKQTNSANTHTIATSQASGKSLQLTYENRSVQSMLDIINKHIKRLDECASFGAFDCAAYVIADSKETARKVASNYNALMRGKESNIQASHINTWSVPEPDIVWSDTDKTNLEKIKNLRKYIGHLIHPRFYLKNNSGLTVTPASIISGNELAIQLGLPKKSINGVTVLTMTPFGRNIKEPKNSNDVIEFGNLYHMGNDEGSEDNKQKVKLDINSFAMHTFITGSTGSGKTTAIYTLLEKLMKHNVAGSNADKIKFMVIEPAKGEYKNRFVNSGKDVKVYGTNFKKTPLLKINPFSFSKDIHVLEHIDRLVEIFNVCWPMYAAMPAVLKDAIERAYTVAGWNLETSENKYSDFNGNPLYPTMIDVLEQVNVSINDSAYSSDSKSDYKGALCTRLQSLTNGLYRQIFTHDELSEKALFDENVIIDLSRIGSSETKSLLMGILIIKLQEYRMSSSAANNCPLKHVTVLEEAHHILKRGSLNQVSGSENVLGKAVEMLSNSIAEMRSYGEGFIIADQAPELMDMSVIRNTNTKIILRLPDISDRELVGRAANLNDDQILELSRLDNFVAAVYQNNWLEPVLCNIDKEFKDEQSYNYSNDTEEIANFDKNEFISYLLLPIAKRDKLAKECVEDLVKDIYKLPVSTGAKVAFKQYTESHNKDELQKLREKILYQLFNTDQAIDLAKAKESNFTVWYQYVKEILEPSILERSILEQKKILAILTKVKADAIDSNVVNNTYKEFWKRILSS